MNIGPGPTSSLPTANENTPKKRKEVAMSVAIYLRREERHDFVLAATKRDYTEARASPLSRKPGARLIPGKNFPSKATGETLDTLERTRLGWMTDNGTN